MKTGETSLRMMWAGRALSALASVPFLMGIATMLRGSPQAAEGMAKYGWSAGSLKTILVLQIVSLALYLTPRTAVFGAIVLTGYLGGAVATHLRIGEAPTAPIVVAVLAWLGLWLREPRLRELTPLRR